MVSLVALCTAPAEIYWVVFNFFFFFSLFIYFERDRESMAGQGQREGESRAGSVLSVEPHAGLELTKL